MEGASAEATVSTPATQIIRTAFKEELALAKDLYKEGMVDTAEYKDEKKSARERYNTGLGARQKMKLDRIEQLEQAGSTGKRGDNNDDDSEFEEDTLRKRRSGSMTPAAANKSGGSGGKRRRTSGLGLTKKPLTAKQQIEIQQATVRANRTPLWYSDPTEGQVDQTQEFGNCISALQSVTGK